MNAVGAIDVGEARRAEHHGVACGRTAKAVRRRVGVMIGLDLDHAPADAREKQCGPDQFGRDLVHTSAKEGAAQRPRHETFSQPRRLTVNRG